MRDAEQTRQKILEISADEIHQQGFKATSLSVILTRCQISKGALYHHFANKQELGYAVLEEIYTPMFLSFWQTALANPDPIAGLCRFFQDSTLESSCQQLISGCPMNNLCQEMATIDEGFRLRILAMQQQLNQLLSDALMAFSSQLKTSVDCQQVAYFIVSAYNGANNLCKTSLHKEQYQQVINELCNYLVSLKKHD